MNIKVQRQKPNRGEGAQGEMRLVIMARGSWLYIKGGNQWHTLNLIPSEERNQSSRRERGDFQRRVRLLTDSNNDNTFDTSGSITDPGGTNAGASLPPATP